ncbi:MAG: TetR/AcrR family transcriptional regulator [Gammaproteobacteria bacterium]
MAAGRKRSFDTSQALDKAMRLFWENGYASTSVNDLSAALGINKPSLYAAFGNKESLFAAALERYTSQFGTPLMDRLALPEEAPLADRVRAYLLGIVDLVSGKGSPTGCLFVKSSCESGSAAMPGDVTASLRDMGSATEQTLTELFATEQENGHLLPHVEPRDFAGYLLSVIYGLAVLARRGKPRQQLKAVVDLTIDALPVPRT